MFARGRAADAGSSRCRVISSTAATPACSCRSSRCRRARAGASARSAICRGSAPGWRTAGFSFVQLLPINEMADGQNSPYSAMSAMAIDPIFISPAAVPDIAALGGEDLLPPGERALLERRARVAGRRLRGRPARSSSSRCAPASSASAQHEWERDTSARAAPEGVPRARALVARRLRALPRAARARAGTLLAGVGRAAPRPQAAPRCGARAQELADRDPVSLVPAVARRRPVERGARGLRDRRVRRLPVHGQRRQRRRLGAAAGLPARRVGRRPAGRVFRDRPGLGLPGLPLGRRSRPAATAGSRRAPAAAPSSTTATASITSSASSAPTCARRTARPRSCRRTSSRSDRSRAKRCSTS